MRGSASCWTTVFRVSACRSTMGLIGFISSNWRILATCGSASSSAWDSVTLNLVSALWNAEIAMALTAMAASTLLGVNLLILCLLSRYSKRPPSEPTTHPLPSCGTWMLQYLPRHTLCTPTELVPWQRNGQNGRMMGWYRLTSKTRSQNGAAKFCQQPLAAHCD